MSRETSLVIGRCWSWSSEKKGSKGKNSLECIPGKGVRARIFGKESWSLETGLVIGRCRNRSIGFGLERLPTLV